MDNQQPYIDPFYNLVPERLWLKVTNIGVKAEGMVKVILEVNGQDKELYNSYVIDGTVSHEFNLTSWLHRYAKNIEATNKALQARVGKLEEAIEGALRIKDIWAPDSTYWAEANQGEAKAMNTMLKSFEALTAPPEGKL